MATKNQKRTRKSKLKYYKYTNFIKPQFPFQTDIIKYNNDN